MHLLALKALIIMQIPHNFNKHVMIKIATLTSPISGPISSLSRNKVNSLDPVSLVRLISCLGTKGHSFWFSLRFISGLTFLFFWYTKGYNIYIAYGQLLARFFFPVWESKATQTLGPFLVRFFSLSQEKCYSLGTVSGLIFRLCGDKRL